MRFGFGFHSNRGRLFGSFCARFPASFLSFRRRGFGRVVGNAASPGGGKHTVLVFRFEGGDVWRAQIRSRRRDGFGAAVSFAAKPGPDPCFGTEKEGSARGLKGDFEVGARAYSPVSEARAGMSCDLQWLDTSKASLSTRSWLALANTAAVRGRAASEPGTSIARGERLGER